MHKESVTKLRKRFVAWRGKTQDLSLLNGAGAMCLPTRESIITSAGRRAESSSETAAGNDPTVGAGQGDGQARAAET